MALLPTFALGTGPGCGRREFACYAGIRAKYRWMPCDGQIEAEFQIFDDMSICEIG